MALVHTRQSKKVKSNYIMIMFTVLLTTKKHGRYYRLTLTTNIKGDRLSLLLGVLVSGKEKEGGGKMDEVYELWDWLVMLEIATDEELRLITGINGLNIETLNAVLYYRTGYRDREQYEDYE